MTSSDPTQASTQASTRTNVLKLLSPGEVASVNTAAAETQLRRGDEYLDLEQPERGVLRADGSPMSMADVLPRKAVHEDTWRRVLRQLQTAATLGLLLVCFGCSAKLGWEQRAPVTTSVATPAVANEASSVAAATTPWSSTERSTRVDERQGEPLHMNPGERCTSYRLLPSLSYSVSTLIQDACLDIPSGTSVDVRGGATLVIVATNGLRVGTGVKLNARGASGRRGARAPFANVRRDIDSDAEIKALCVDRGNQCTCPATSLEAIQGRPGQAGSPGGSLQLVAGELTLLDKLNGFASDVSGGAGGPPGDSGTQECRRGELRCSSPACSAGEAFGAPGLAGTLVLAVAGSTNAAGLARSSARAVPAGALTVTEVGPSLLERGAELDREAMQKGWQRLAGRTP